MDLDIESGLDLIKYAIDKDVEEMLYTRWCHDLQFQMSFDEFKAKLTPQIQKDEEEILEDVQDILKMFEWR